MKKLVFLLLGFLAFGSLRAEDGYRLWLRYDRIDNAVLLQNYQSLVPSVSMKLTSPVLGAAAKELKRGWKGLTGKDLVFTSSVPRSGLVIRTTAEGSLPAWLNDETKHDLGEEGYIIRTQKLGANTCIFIIGNTDRSLLYGVFHFLRLVQTQQSIQNLQIREIPRMNLRLLNHWDNLDRHVERGYAGLSIWDWHTLPGFLDQRYTDYARANASIGINGTVLTNVNANARILTPPYLEKVKALADIFRPYGIRVYLTARFSAPIEIGKLKTADPLNDSVRTWWKKKADEIYSLIPDFGGFLVKANSEGQPGPQDYHRNHADGANMLAEALAPHNGVVMWRAFVYSQNSDDRFKQAYEEFKPLDGSFASNVLLQVKNGPIDFQPREPFSPLFGAMPQTPLMMEFQLTQEYLGQGTHLVYEAPLFKECFESDTYAKGKGSTVARVVDGSLYQHRLSGIAGVSNIGNSTNWTFHPFGQANWYAFGRLAWNHEYSSEKIAEEWIAQTFSNNKEVVRICRSIMMQSRAAMVNYMTPLGLHHIMNNGHHYGPAPWSNTLRRPDWNPVYYHRADSTGIGFDRTQTGTNALAQYPSEVRNQFENPATCDEDYLLWFHHVSWDHRMNSGKTLWEELCLKYQEGVTGATAMKKEWNQVKTWIDPERFEKVRMLLSIQQEEAVWWRDACLSYFRQFSGMPIPASVPQPAHSLDYYKSLSFPSAPGN